MLSPVLPQVVAPGVGPDVTLVVTDVQGSTSLWEALPADLVEHAMKLHEQVGAGWCPH